jgi:hypothetical protein
MLKNDSRYHLYVALKNSSIIGISLLYIFEDLKMALLEHYTNKDGLNERVKDTRNIIKIMMFGIKDYPGLKKYEKGSGEAA